MEEARTVPAAGDTVTREEVGQIPVDQIAPSRFQPRRAFDDRELKELAASINQYGVLQPILVRPAGKGYELVAGERRLRACRLAGVKTIPAVVKAVSDRELALMALVENLQREDLNVLEEAEGYDRLLREFGLTQEDLARQLGRSQSSIANKLRLLRLPEEVRLALSRGAVTERHARALLSLATPEQQVNVLRHIVAGELNVRQTEALVEQVAGGISREIRDGRPPAGEGKRRIVRVFKDIRIFLNAFRQAVQTLQRAGLPAEMVEEDGEEYLEVRVRIPKTGRGRQASQTRRP